MEIEHQRYHQIPENDTNMPSFGSALESQSQSQSDQELQTPLIDVPSNHNDASDDDVDKWASMKNVINIYADQSGSCQNITKGLSIMFAIGAITGLVMPKNPSLTPTYRTISSIIGYIYFVSWSVSYYPQLITNYQKKSIDGLSTDASILAVLNYTCYALYNGFFFWDETIRQEYKDRHGPDATVTVQSNDVAFSIHALILTFFLLFQIFYYGGFQSQPISSITKGIVFAVLALSGGYIACIQIYGWLWIDFLYLMATIKLILTILTYLPQIILNAQRKSTSGWNVWVRVCMRNDFQILGSISHCHSLLPS